MLLFCLSALASAGIAERDGNRVIVSVEQPSVEGARIVCVEVVGERIFRVRATAEPAFPIKKESLIILPQTSNVKFDVRETQLEVTVATRSMKALVRKSDGNVRFFDANGKLLTEEAENGKRFKPFYVPDREIGVDLSKVSDKQRRGWTWQLLMDNPGEALYGLGQHQSEELNMLGKNEDLYQYNTKVSVPFVVSNKNFGVLWDSYSYCRFGNPDYYLQLNRAFRLYDKDGRDGGLTGTYTDRRGQTLVRQEDSLYYEYDMPAGSALCKATDKGGIQNLPKGFNLEGAEVVYEGFIEPLHASLSNNPYQFILYYAGYIKVYIGGELVVPERWRTAWNPNSYKFTSVVSGKTAIRIEWQPDGGVSYCGLRVAEPRTDGQLRQLSIWSEMSPDMDYYFICGSNLDEVISGYRTLTGKAPVYPKWVLGFWQSRERYKTAGEVEQTLDEFRRRRIPIDNIVQDWNYWRIDDWGSHEFEPSRFANPQAMLDSVHQMHGRFMISVWPKFYCATHHYKELDAKGWMYHQAVEDDIHDWLGYLGSFYDAYDEGARRLFWQQMDNQLYSRYNRGIDAWWMDASEPNVRDCTPMWYRKALSGPTALGTSTEYFNAYSIVNADAIYNGQRSVYGGQSDEPRVFLLTRSGFAGEQRYSTATWSGDIGTRWEDMRAQMTAGMNYSLAGLPFWGMDQGGFCVENRYVRAQQHYDRTGEETEDLKEWRELQARWSQFGAFIPLFRVHGQWPLREIWNIAPENHPAYQSFVYYDKFRYRLMPYLYSMAGWVHLNDYTMMRALVMDFNGDRQVYDIKDQWMFGPSLMACPVGFYKARSRSVYLPGQCGWYDLYDGTYYEGGQTIEARVPYSRIPVYVPAGAILPMGPDMEWSDEKAADPLTLFVYAGRDGQFVLYEDEGTNYNYERGDYSTIEIRYDDKTHTLTIGNRQGAYKGMLKERTFNVVLVNPSKCVGIDSLPITETIRYKGKALKMRL